MKSKKIYIIYLIYAADGKHDGYVGWTNKPLEKRFYFHRYLAEHGYQHHVHRWLRKIRFKVKKKVLEVVTSRSYKAAERKWIKYYRNTRKWRLKNMTDGGDGVLGLRYKMSKSAKKEKSRITREWNLAHPGARKGVIFSKSHRKNISIGVNKAIKKYGPPTLGYKHSPEFKQALSIRVGGKNNPMYGYHWTKKERQHLSKMLSGRKASKKEKKNKSRATAFRWGWHPQNRSRYAGWIKVFLKENKIPLAQLSASFKSLNLKEPLT